MLEQCRAGPIRTIFREAFAAAGLPYFNPHSFRDTLVQLGAQICPTIEAFKAWSQNLGHERVMATLTNYGTVEPHRQAELIRGMNMREGDRMSGAELANDPDVIALIKRITKRMARPVCKVDFEVF